MLGPRLLSPALACALLCTTLAPPAAADHDVLHSAQEIGGEALQYANGVVGDGVSRLPACTASDPQWTAACQDEETMVACGTDASALYRCRLVFEGNGGDMDGSSAEDLAQAGGSVAGAVPGRALDTVSALEGASDLLTTSVSEINAWLLWTGTTLAELAGVLLAAKQPYEDAGMAFAIGVQSESDEYADKNRRSVEEVFQNSVHGAASPDVRFTVHLDSGPATVSATTTRPADDPCHPGQGLLLLGSDCMGPRYVNAEPRASVACNAYTSIVLAQPCGGYVSQNWNWNIQGMDLYPRPLQAARLVAEPDGRLTIHDALGVLHCNNPDRNGYWMQSGYLDLSTGFFKDRETGEDTRIGKDSTNTFAPFGVSGTCTVSQGSDSYRVAYDHVWEGIPLRATGFFTTEKPAQNLTDCEPEVDTRTPMTDGCHSVIHGGGS